MYLDWDRNSPQALQLLQFLSNELYKDGGTTLAPWLKEYAKYPKRINALLLATVRCKRLLTFIEQFPDIFSVSRERNPHLVSLRKLDFCEEAILCDTTLPVHNATAEDESTNLAKNVHEKARYTLRRRQTRISRRNVSKSHDTVVDHEASLAWLLDQCAMVLHHYLRAVKFYPAAYKTKCLLSDGLPPMYCRVGEKEWSDLVLASFKSLLLDQPDIRITDTKVTLIVSQDNNVSTSDVKAIGIALHNTIAMDGATQVCLSLLLARYHGIQKLLGGRDIMALMEVDPEAFHGLHIWKNDIGDVVLRLEENSEVGGRMLVDEVGLFSVASGRWGTAIANTLAQETGKFLNRHPSEITAIDLTAGVGGLTLAMSKHFGHIIAIEIDKHRAELCLQNMRHHRRTNVEVRNTDAMDAIENFDVRSVTIIIDPPWGGHEYKRLKKAVAMGRYSLDQVIVKCFRKFAPVVIGIRLPTNYDYSLLERSVTVEGIAYDSLLRRRLGPQLLVVIAAR